MGRILSRTAPRLVPRSDYLLGLIFGSGSPGALHFFEPDGVDTISLSVDDYGLIGADLQAALFDNPTTPIVFDDFAALWAAVSALPNLNLGNYMGTIEKGFAIYTVTTDRSTLNRGLRWFGLAPIYPEFGPTWNDADVWEDVALWTE